MPAKFFIFFAILTLGQQSLAASICSDLAAYTCAAGEPHDGTGRVKLVGPLEFVTLEIARIEPRLRIDFTEMLTGAKGSELRRTAIEAYEFGEEKSCQQSTDNSDCVGLIVDRLINTYKLTEFGPEIVAVDTFMPGNAAATARLTSSPQYKKIVTKISKTENESNKTLALKIEKELFPRTKDLLLARISSLSMDESQKQLMLAKVRSAKYDGANCMPKGNKTSGIASAFLPNAFYNPQTHSFSFCGGYLSVASSDFSLVQTIAHELSHAIDPCRISDGSNNVPFSQRKADPEIEDAYLRKDFLRCLRSPKSVSAVHYQDETPMPTDYLEGRAYNDTKRLCGGDQLNEAVPDWFAAEVVANYSKTYLKRLTKKQQQAGFANIHRATCREVRNDQSEHPSSLDRINGLLLVQPTIRKQMGCTGKTPDRRYCDADNPDSLKEKPLKSGSSKSKNKAVK